MKRILITLISGIYLFVVLFSQNFHDHGSGEVFKDFHFQKSEKTISNASHFSENTECLSCHILYDGHGLVLQKFQFTFLKSEFFRNQLYTYNQKFANHQIFGFYLRGPPVNFI